MFCSKCGKEIDDAAVICVHCGVATQNMKEQQASSNQPVINIQNTNANANNNGYGFPISPKSKLTALILAIFVGVFGIHRFYVGKIGTGLLYMLTLGLGGVGVLYDIIMIAIGSFRDSYGLMLKN